jgi:hypothetical protein
MVHHHQQWRFTVVPLYSHAERIQSMHARNCFINGMKEVNTYASTCLAFHHLLGIVLHSPILLAHKALPLPALPMPHNQTVFTRSSRRSLPELPLQRVWC